MTSASRWPIPIAIVDDDADVLGALTFAFEVEGFLVSGFSDAESLLAQPNLPDWCTFVVDQKLPGLNGLDLIGQLRARGCEAPALLITTPSVELAARAARAGVPIIEKPLLCDTLVDTVRKLMDAR